jgi:hypothetical protein
MSDGCSRHSSRRPVATTPSKTEEEVKQGCGRGTYWRRSSCPSADYPTSTRTQQENTVPTTVARGCPTSHPPVDRYTKTHSVGDTPRSAMMMSFYNVYKVKRRVVYRCSSSEIVEIQTRDAGDTVRRLYTPQRGSCAPAYAHCRLVRTVRSRRRSRASLDRAGPFRAPNTACTAG